MKKLHFNFRIILSGFLLSIGIAGKAQQQISLEEAISIALENNFMIRQAALDIQQAEYQKKHERWP